MHVAFGQFSRALEAGADIHGDLAHAGGAAPRRAVSLHAAPVAHSSYGERRFSFGSIAIVAAIHAILFAALVTLDVVPVAPAKRAPTVVEMVELSATPPPAAPPPPVPQTQEAKAPDPVRTPIVAPPPVVRTFASPPVVAAAEPAPQPPAPAAPKAAPAPAVAVADAGPVDLGDISTKGPIHMVKPRLPLESRKKKEQGAVVLRVLLEADGSVADTSVASSSGFPRLDRAVIEAVRKWRWAPTIRDGHRVTAKGMLRVTMNLSA